MTPEYVMELADMVDPGQLWRRGSMDQLELPDGQRRQLDAGVALRRYAHHLEELRALIPQQRSLLITPFSENSSAIRSVDTPPDHAEMRKEWAGHRREPTPDSGRATPIPISAGADICRKYGYHQVVIMARRVGDDGVEHVTTYGVDKTHCRIAANIGYDLKYRVMKWDRRTTGESERCIKTDGAPLGTNCSICGLPQYSTPSGATCANGHGGAPAATPTTNPTTKG